MIKKLRGKDCSIPQSFGIIAAGHELADAPDHARAVFAVGDAKPRIAGAQYFHSRIAGNHQFVDNARNVTLGLLVPPVLCQERRELRAQDWKNLRRETPEI